MIGRQSRSTWNRPASRALAPPLPDLEGPTFRPQEPAMSPRTRTVARILLATLMLSLPGCLVLSCRI